jgi:hypothetical protein
MPRPFPRINQKNAATDDGQPDENAGDNCVPASLAAALQDILGRPFSPDALKDATYGQGYRGKQAIKNYVLYCQKQGVSLVPLAGAPVHLASELHEHARRRIPCLVTIPSNGKPPADRNNPGSTHVVCVFDDEPGRLVGMNPWGGVLLVRSDSWWSDRLCFGKIWTVEAMQIADGAQGAQPGATPVTQPAPVDATADELARLRGENEALRAQLSALSGHGSVEALRLVQDIIAAVKAVQA